MGDGEIYIHLLGLVAKLNPFDANRCKHSFCCMFMKALLSNLVTRAMRQLKLSPHELGASLTHISIMDLLLSSEDSKEPIYWTRSNTLNGSLSHYITGFQNPRSTLSHNIDLETEAADE